MKIYASLAALVLAFVAGRYEFPASPAAPQDAAPAKAAPQDGKQDAKQDDKKSPTPPAGSPMADAMKDPAAAMKRWTDTLKPSSGHQFLHQFLGKWETTMRFHGMSAGMPATKGTAEYRWLVEGKWLLREAHGTMPGMGPVTSFAIVGFDNYKRKYVSVHVDSLTTAMLSSEGMIDQTGKNLCLYGPMDEPMSGEHDKPVKYATRVVSADEHVDEVHDLAIGETQTMVIETVYKRVK